MKNLMALLFALALVSCANNSGTEAEQWRKSDMKIAIEVTNDSGATAVLAATLADNSSAKGLYEKLSAGALTIGMEDFSSFEKVGELGFSLPQNNTHISADAGDLILYQGSRFVIYYDRNSWNFTRLGKLDAIADGSLSKAELKKVLGRGGIKAVLSVQK